MVYMYRPTHIIIHVHHVHVHATCTVEPLNNVTFGTGYSVHYREVPFFGGYKCVSTIGK